MKNIYSLARISIYNYLDGDILSDKVKELEENPVAYKIMKQEIEKMEIDMDRIENPSDEE